MLSCCASPRKKPAGKGVSSNSLFNSSQLLTATQSPDATLPISTAASPSIAEDEACAPCDADTSSRMPFSSCADSPYTASDAEWLLRHHRRKVLDTRVKIVGVAARSADAQRSPAVLMCYPLRVTQRDDAESDAGTHEQRRETRGGRVAAPPRRRDAPRTGREYLAGTASSESPRRRRARRRGNRPSGNRRRVGPRRAPRATPSTSTARRSRRWWPRSGARRGSRPPASWTASSPPRRTAWRRRRSPSARGSVRSSRATAAAATAWSASSPAARTPRRSCSSPSWVSRRVEVLQRRGASSSA